MADYRELLRRAMETLPENNGAARRQVYEKARAALVAQLRAIDPPLPAREITQHRLQLEDCIREVEQEATDRLLGGLKANEEAETEVAAEADTPEITESDMPEPTVENAVEPEPAEAEEPAPEPEPEAPVEDEPVAEKVSDTEETSEAVAASEPDEPTVEDGDEADNDASEDVTDNDVAAALAEAEEALRVAEDDVDTSDEDAIMRDADEVVAAVGELHSTQDTSQDAIAAVLAEYQDLSAEVDNLVTQGDEPAVENDEPEPGSMPFAAAPEPDFAQEPDEEISSEPEHTGPLPGTIEFIIAQAQAAADEAAVPTRWRADAIASGMATATDVMEEERPEPDPEPEPEPQPAYTNGAAAPHESVQAKTAVSETAMSRVREVDVEGEGNDPQFVVDKAIAALDREARGEGSSEDAEDATTAAEAVLERSKPLAGSGEASGGGNALTIFLVLFLVLLAGVGGAGYWAWREGYIDLDTMFGVGDTTAPVTEVAGTTTTPAPEADSVADGPGNTAAFDTSAETPAESDLSQDRLPATEPVETPEVSTTTETPQEAATDDTPAAADPEPAIAEPTSDAAKTEERLPTSDDAAAADTETADAGTSDATADESAVAPVGAQSLLLEASSEGTTGAVPFSGTVEWTRGVDELGLPTLIASAKIPARNLGVDMLIRLNSDPALPASHIMEIDFDVSETFPGGSISNLPGVLLKNEELSQGTLLAGASARVVGNSFLFALSAAEQDRANNITLLGRKWLDLALIYGSGKHAIITLEKDDAANAMFDEVLAAWAAASAEQASGDG